MDKLQVGILIFDDVEVLDFAGPFEVFSRTRLEGGTESRTTSSSAPFDVFTVAKNTGAVKSTGGLRVIPHCDFRSSPCVDLLVVPGGFGTRPLLDDEQTLDWIREASAQAKYTTSVCTGALLLAKAGLLRRRRATTHWAALNLLASLDPSIQVERRRWVDEGTVVTSAGVSAGIDMSFLMVEKICGVEVANETARYIEHERSPAEQ